MWMVLLYAQQWTDQEDIFRYYKLLCTLGESAPGQFPSFSQVIMQMEEKCQWFATASTFFVISTFSLKFYKLSQS